MWLLQSLWFFIIITTSFQGSWDWLAHRLCMSSTTGSRFSMLLILDLEKAAGSPFGRRWDHSASPAESLSRHTQVTHVQQSLSRLGSWHGYIVSGFNILGIGETSCYVGGKHRTIPKQNLTCNKKHMSLMGAYNCIVVCHRKFTL